MRIDGRQADQIRPVKVELDYTMHAEGSVLISMGQTKVICTASIEERVPPFLRGQGKGWITAEYSMLPRATEQRNMRESTKGKVTGRTMEIQRLIGRALRSIIDLDKLGERTIWIDCDVIQADGGTRTTSITGAFIALAIAVSKLKNAGKISMWPIQDYLAAISVGVDTESSPLLDLCYVEDASAQVDMNVIMTGAHQFVEIQGTGEEATFSRDEMNTLLDYAEKGIEELFDIQKQALGEEIDTWIAGAKPKKNEAK
ncbi:ribonuclease PH [Alkalihalobacillus pseudalcaliphilus]|uniref:ribonuclease PH n=1 Tax=Alkalihalobacillus pseudalcaliphilus TaxID=79884 RepID=UPI00064DB7CC|nr:ribonuclease PH [Alkalihalobacillus pseudalcaliphilus]KMK74613.1 ribonuclease PH [Alkalihalobacillus pseudalcaliphilus]